jgi:hypothetical protein
VFAWVIIDNASNLHQWKVDMDAENIQQVFTWLWISGQLSGREIESLPAPASRPLSISPCPPSFHIVAALEGMKIWGHCAKDMRVSVFISLYRRLSCLVQNKCQ